MEDLSNKIETLATLNNTVKILKQDKITLLKQTYITDNKIILDIQKDIITSINNLINKTIQERDEYIIYNKLLEYITINELE